LNYIFDSGIFSSNFFLSLLIGTTLGIISGIGSGGKYFSGVKISR